MKTQQIKRKDLAKIYKEVCISWQKIIADLLVEQVDSDIIEVSNELITKAYNEADSDKKKLVNKYFDIIVVKKITDRINDLGDVFKLLSKNEDDFFIFKNPKSKFEKYINACALIPEIVRAYNEGEELDWNGPSSKYLPYFRKVGSYWVFHRCSDWGSGADGPAGHHYKNPTILNDACKKFEKIYSDYYSYTG